MRTKTILGIALITVCFVTLLPFAAQAQVARTGVIAGRVNDIDGVPLPGATVTLSSAVLIGGDKTTVTTMEGTFRFPALPPGTYSVTASMQGFDSQLETDIGVSSGVTLTLTFQLVIGVTDTITVRGEAPLVDIKSSSTANTHMDERFIQSLPTGRGMEDLINLVPGTVSRSAFGGPQNGTQWRVDGISQNDPEGGEGAIAVDFDNIAEINFTGVGGEAAVGGYSGIIVSAITKSGGNEVHGAANIFMVRDGWNSQNSDNPRFRREVNNNRNWHVDLGGPIAVNKAWIYGSFRRSVSNDQAETGELAGYGKSNSLFFKATWQPTPDDKVMGSVDIDKFTAQDGSDEFVAPEATFAPFETARSYTAEYLRVFSSNTYLDAKFSVRDDEGADFPGGNSLPPGHYDFINDYSWNSPGWFFERFRNRYQANVALTHYAEDFLAGSHDFKAGWDGDWSMPKTAQGLTSGVWYEDYGSEPDFKIEMQDTVIDPRGTAHAFYLQDSWTIGDGRLTINPGLRINHWYGENKGYVGPCCDGVPGADVTASDFTPKMGFAPRIGATFDILGDGTTALKVHWGRYYDQFISAMYANFDAFPRIEERGSFWDDGEWVLDFEDRSEGGTPNDPNIRMSNTTEFTVGLERQLTPVISVEVTGIFRTANDFMDQVRLNGEWDALWVPDEAGNLWLVFDLLNGDDSEYIQTNPADIDANSFMPPPMPGANAWVQTRDYWALDFNIEKRFADNWQLMGSYVYSESSGTDDTEFSEGEGRGSSLGFSSQWTDPNVRFGGSGPTSHDRPHQIKITGSAIFPYEILAGFFYRGVSGQAFEKSIRFRGDFEGDDRIERMVEPRGSRRMPWTNKLDLRAEKVFDIGSTQLSVLVDIFNLFNANTTTNIRTYEDQRSSVPFGDVRGIMYPRRFRLGFRFEF